MSDASLQTPMCVSGLTIHAGQRMHQRRITAADVADVIEYGRVMYAKGAVYHVVGRREIKRAFPAVDLQHLDGVHVICTHDGVILTVYRNRSFQVKALRDMKPRRTSARQATFAA